MDSKVWIQERDLSPPSTQSLALLLSVCRSPCLSPALTRLAKEEEPIQNLCRSVKEGRVLGQGLCWGSVEATAWAQFEGLLSIPLVTYNIHPDPSTLK